MAVADEIERGPQHRVPPPCGHAGRCKKPRLKGEKSCFDHLDLDELERQINEPDDEDLADNVIPIPTRPRDEEAAPVAAQEETPVAIKCKQGCGKEFKTDGAWRANHELKCKGKVATSGRIAAGAGGSGGASSARADELLRSSKKPALPVSRPQVRGQNRKRERLAEPDLAGLISHKVVLASLRLQATKLQTAIAAIEALG